MKKFILESPPDSLGNVYIGGKDFHYLAVVRRMKPGSVFEAILPDGTCVNLTVVSVTGKTMTASCSLRRAPDQQDCPFVPPLYLFQSLPRGAKMDLIVRQAAETGVSRIVPFVSGYSQAKTGKTIDRWAKIVREARQQSGSLVPTSVEEPLDFDGLLKYWKDLIKEQPCGTGILLHQDPLESLTFHDYLDNSPQFVALAVGPEGGFSPEEVRVFMSAGFKPVVMGNTVLRTETAALYGAAAIRTILSERASWLLKNKMPL